MRRYETEHAVRWYLVERPHWAVQVVQHRQVDRSQRQHSHDRSYLDVVLRGGYTEDRWARGLTVRTRVRHWSRRPASAHHRIVALHREPTWVLKLQGRKRDPRP